MTTITIERAILDRLIDAWDSTVLPKSRDGMMQERMEDLRAALAAPATAPERPNPYDACESFKAYQLSCRREAVLQKEIERLLAAPATEPDRHAQELLAMDITIANMNERHAQELCAYELTVQNLRDQIASAPAWHDAPTVPGLWVVNWRLVEVRERELWAGQEGRWFGPIPPDSGEQS